MTTTYDSQLGKTLDIKVYIPFVAVAISILALFFAIKNYQRKSGIYVKGSYSITQSAYAEDMYVSSIILENNKDRSVIIFKVFIQVGNNYYIELENFENEPKILKPYESYMKSLDPVDFYCLNMRRIKFNKLLKSRKYKARLILSTSHGKYIVTEGIKRWDPIFDFFKNHLTSYVIPMRPTEKIGFFGSEFRYLVKIKTQDGYTNSIPIYTEDYNQQRFPSFSLTYDLLLSRDKLETFLIGQAVDGNLKCASIEVLDAEEIRKSDYRHDFGESMDAIYYNNFTYIILGRLFTLLSNLSLSFRNKKLRARSKIK